MNSKGTWIILIVLFFLIGAAASFFLSKKMAPAEKIAASVVSGVPSGDRDELMNLRLYFPLQGSLQIEERRVPARAKQIKIAETVIEEYFKGPSRDKSGAIPEGVRLLGLYQDAAHILYIDLSDEARRNFQGDARSEYLLLKGFTESLLSNLQDYKDFKILVEGKELESLGGHLYLKFPLMMVLSSDARKTGEFSRE